MRARRSLLVLAVAATALAGITHGAGDSAILTAVRAQDATALRAALRRPEGINTPGADGMTPLHWAAYNDDVPAIELLLKAGARVATLNRYGATALSLAARNGSAEAVERLLKAGADANAALPPTSLPEFTPEQVPNAPGETVLMTAARTGNVRAVKLLLAAGAKVNTRENWRGQTALMYAVAENHPDIVAALLENGADAGVRTLAWTWPDHKPKGADPLPKYSQEPGNMTALMYAAREGAVESARLLIDAGADINEADPARLNPLLEAVLNGHWDVAMLLLERGANPNDGGSLFTTVDIRNLDRTDARPAPKSHLEKRTSLDVIRLMLDKGADPSGELSKRMPNRVGVGQAFAAVGSRPLIRASKATDVTVVKLLLERGADANVALRDKSNALMAASGQGYDARVTTGGSEENAIEVITMLLARGVNVNDATDQGVTPLHFAAVRGAERIAAFLVEKGARIDAKNKNGHTPLDYAMGIGSGRGGAPGNPQPGVAALLKRLM